MNEIIVIGAGAAGLMAALEVSRAGCKVIVLEAQSRIGGRVFTLHDTEFSSPVELGAEFVHGELPVTLGLLKEANISCAENGGSFWSANEGKLSRGYGFMRDWSALENALKQLKEDMSIDAFLEKYLNEEKYSSLKIFVKRFAEGYDAADTSRASTFAFRNEWMKENDEGQYRINGGYGKLMQYMADECRKAGAEIHTSVVVTEIKWGKGKVEVVAGNKTYKAGKVIATVPAGVLQAGQIKFSPAIPGKMKAFQTIGYGNALKVFLQFNNAFWQQEPFVKKFGEEVKELSFIVSDAPIPTWWTQFPAHTNMITGWAGGPNTLKFAVQNDEEVLQAALNSLAYIFNTDKDFLKKELVAWKVANWANNPFELGAYTYSTVESLMMKDSLDEPVEDTLYFAGEAFYNGPEMGTVEAALASGKKTAKNVLSAAH